jgi:hypothetical protein
MSHADSVRPPRRAFWGDARFLLGILLIVASVAGVWLVVAAARQTAPVYAAARTLVPGQAITAEDLRQVDVALGQLGEAYLAPGGWNDGLVATRTIEAGELVPADAVGDADRSRTTNVVVQSSVEVPASVDAGTDVEVWAAPLLEAGQYDEPRILVADATVVSVTRDDSMMGGGAASLELVIPRADVAATLAALAHEAAISVIPAAGGGA